MPLMDVIFIIAPDPLAFIPLATACAIRKYPVRLTSITFRQSSAAKSKRGPNLTILALFTSKSGIWPSFCRAFAMDSSLDTSAARGIASGISAAIFSVSSRLRSNIPTL